MRLRRRKRRIHIVQIPRESRLRLRRRYRIIKPVDEGYNSRGEGRGGGAREAVVLEDPEGGAVGVGGERGVFGVDLRVGAAVDVNDGEPGLGRGVREDGTWAEGKIGLTLGGSTPWAIM